jgi:hypothetical protein
MTVRDYEFDFSGYKIDDSQLNLESSAHSRSETQSRDLPSTPTAIPKADTATKYLPAVELSGTKPAVDENDSASSVVPIPVESEMVNTKPVSQEVALPNQAISSETNEKQPSDEHHQPPASSTSNSEVSVPTEVKPSAVTYQNPYTQSLQERVDELQKTAPEGFNRTGEGTAAINSLEAEEKQYPDSEFVSGDGRLRSHATMRNSEGVLTEGIEAGERRSSSALQLLFFTISSSERLDHPGYALDIARQVRMDKDCYQVLELAEKVQEPALRRALQLSAYEEYMERVGGSYYKIALRDVENMKTTPLTADEMKARESERKARLAEQQQELSQPRPGLSDAEKTQLANILPHVASSREFWENVRRSRHDW